jgi:hypothetical protein
MRIGHESTNKIILGNDGWIPSCVQSKIDPVAFHFCVDGFGTRRRSGQSACCYRQSGKRDKSE